MIRVLLADDQALIRSGIRALLDAEDDIEVVGEAADGAACLRAVRELAPDVVLMDVRMPTMDGVEATRRLVEAGNPARVLILTTFDLDDYVYAAMRAGASGFLLKDVGRDELVHAVRTVARGDQMLAPAVTRRLDERFVTMPPPATGVPEALTALSSRERDVLALVARGLSNAEVATALVIGEATVKTHVARVLDKLGLRDRVQAAVLAYETGFVQPGSAPPG
jgi:DNA-binding NarL/FixJ family response regulator